MSVDEDSDKIIRPLAQLLDMTVCVFFFFFFFHDLLIKITVNSEIFARILFLRKALKDILRI